MVQCEAMAEWHVRGVDEALAKAVKVAAFGRGLTVQAFIVEAARSALGAGSGTAPARVAAPTVTKVSRSVAAVVEASSIPDRYAGKMQAHDPATCRLYRCGLCAVAKA